MNRSSHVCLIRLNTAAGPTATCIDSDRFTIGRVGADFIVADKGVSRVHLKVHVRGRDIWLEDMNSANGTYVAGERLEPGVPVQYRVNAPVQLGVSRDVLTFELVEKTMTQTAAAESAAVLEKNPSQALSTPAPSVEVAVQADNFLREARETAAGMKEAASREAENLLNTARTKANEVLSSARREADTLLEKARSSASQATLDREAAAETALANARREALTVKTQADEEAERIAKDARLSASQIRVQAQKEAEDVLRLAREKAAELKDRAENEARDLIRQTRDKNRAAIEQNESDIEKALAEARQTAAQIRNEADALLEKARSYMQDKGEHVMRDVQEEAEKIRREAAADAERLRQDAVADAGRVREQARAEGIRTIESGLREAELEISRVKDHARNEIEDLAEAKKRLAFEIGEIEKRKSLLLNDTESYVKSHEEAQRKARELETELESVQALHEKSKAELALAKTMRESAEKEREAAVKAKRDAEQETERIRKEAYEQKSELTKELKEMREKGLLEFEERKKLEDSEIANLKLKWLEEMKARQFEDEKQQRALKTHQMVELSRHLEMLVVPLVQNKFPDKDTSVILAEIKEELGPMVKRVMLEEQIAQGSSEIEQVLSADPIIEKLKKRERLRNRAMFAVPTLLFVAAVVAPGVFEVVRRPLETMTGMTLSEYEGQKRARQLASRPKFNPALIDELGKTYSDSVLYTRNYVALKLDPKNQARWAVELEKYMFDELGLPEQATVSYVAAETSLVKELHQQRELINPEFEAEGIQRLRDIEQNYQTDLVSKVGGDIAFEKIKSFEKKFFESVRKPAGL